MTSHRSRRATPIRLAALVAAGSLVLASCGEHREAVYPVQGKVLFHNQPAQHATVIFHPQGGSEEVQKMRPHGTVDAEGNFALTTFDPDDGAPAGDYRVTVVWPGESREDAMDAEDPEHVPSGPDRLQKRYKDPQTSGLSATVSEGTNQLEPFQLQ